MQRFRLDGAAFDTSLCFIEYQAPIMCDVGEILQRHGRAAFEPGSVVQVWGGRLASSWQDDENIVVVETVIFSTPGWQGPLTHVEVVSGERHRAHQAAIARGEFTTPLAFPEPHSFVASEEPAENVRFLRSMNHSLISSRGT